MLLAVFSDDLFEFGAGFQLLTKNKIIRFNSNIKMEVMNKICDVIKQEVCSMSFSFII